MRAATGNPDRATADEVRMFMDAPDFDAANDSFVVERAGRIIGYTDLEFSDKTGRAWSEGYVHPDCWRQGIGTELIKLGEKRALEWAADNLKPDQAISIQRFTNAGNTEAQHVLEASGYRYIRSFYQMRISLRPAD